MTETVRFGGNRTQERLRQRILELPSRYDVPVGEDGFSIRRDEGNHTYIDASYTQPVELLPGYPYPWSFACHIDVIVITPMSWLPQ